MHGPCQSRVPTAAEHGLPLSNETGIYEAVNDRYDFGDQSHQGHRSGMVRPRHSRSKYVPTSPGAEGHSAHEDKSSKSSEEDDEPVQSRRRNAGRLKSVKGSSRTQQTTAVPSNKEQSSPKSRAKSKAPGAKAKSAVKDQLKPIAKPIYSFFNTATEKQRTLQLSTSPEKPSNLKEELEGIHDDTEDETPSASQFSKGSNIALAVRKRKVQQNESFENEIGLPPPASQKFRKTSSGDRVPSFSGFVEDKRPWTEQFAPVDLSELAVHKRKVSDVRQWLQAALSGRRQKVLVLKGAAGTGKTTTVRLLAGELGASVLEWKNPAGSELAVEGSASASIQFEDFIGRSGRSGGLRLISDGIAESASNSTKPEDGEMVSNDLRQVILIEEFPNTFSRTTTTLQSFRSTILQYLSSPAITGSLPIPIIMVISETLLSTNTALADSFTAHRLLGPELVNHPYLDIIEFNAVAPTIIMRALETIVIKEARKSGRRKTPGPQVLKHLAECGDIRSAISSLEFLCLRGDQEDAWSARIMFTKSKKSKSDAPLTKSEEEALKLVSNRESTLGIFHSVGKVVYNKRVDPNHSQSVPQPPPWLPQHRRTKIPETKVDQLIDELGTDTSTFVAALHENYALSCSCASTEDSLDSLLGCIDNISDADLLSVDRFSFGTRAYSGSTTDSIRQDEMAFQVAVRGLLFGLPYPVHRSQRVDGKKGDAHRMFYPSSIKLWKKREEIEGTLDLLTMKLQSDRFSSTLQTRGGHDREGVSSWRRGNAPIELSTTSATPDPNEIFLTRNNTSKIEMLIDRLPYMMQVHQSTRLPAGLMEQISTVTRIHGFAPVTEDEEGDMDDPGEPGLGQWTTDQPDEEAPPKSVKSRMRTNPTRKKDGGGLGIPVENSVENLVLEDDDIIDD